MRRILAILILTACGTESPAPPTSAALPRCATSLDGDRLAKLRVPGVSVGIVAGGKLACVGVAGKANLEADRDVTPDTTFLWASVSKTFVAHAAMRLVDEGKLELDANVEQYVPFPVKNPRCATTPITLRQLLTHTSSILDDDAVYDATYTAGDSPVVLGDFVAQYTAEDHYATACPGAINEYSNVAAGGLVPHIIERVTGQPFDRYTHDTIFAPLGMTETSWRLADLDVDNVAMPYDGPQTAFTPHGHVGLATYPDDLIRTSVPQLAKFLTMSIDLGVHDGQRLMSEASAREMRRLQIPTLDATQGLIWYYDYDDKLLGHDGEDFGASSYMYFDPSTGDGAMIVANAIWNSTTADALLAELIAEAATW